MKQKKIALFCLLITCVFFILVSCSSNIPVTESPINCCNYSSETIPPEIATLAYGTVFTELTRVSSLTATNTPIPTATETPRPTETVWRTEPVSTVDSITYTPLDIYGLENLPAPIVQPLSPLWEEGASLGEKIARYFKENGMQSPPSGTPVFVDKIVSIDLDEDGKPETAVSYEFGYDGYSYGLGVAIIRGQTVIAATPPIVKGAYPQTHLLPVQLSPNRVGLLYHVVTSTGGSGIYPYIYRRILTFQNKTLQTVWTWDYPGGARAGAAYRHFANEKLEFKHLTGQQYADVLLTRQVEGSDFPEPFFGENPANYANYNLHLPGGLVFSFDGKAYRLSHYYDGQALFSIHPIDFFVHAPRLRDPVQASEDLTSLFHQIEYMDAQDGYGYGTSGRSAEVRGISVAWDEQRLYMRVMAWAWGEKSRSSTIWVGLDTDLQSDFNDPLLNKDDYLFKLEIPDTKVCQGNLSVHMAYPERIQIPFENQLSDSYCIVDFSIPLDAIHLNIPSPKIPGKVLKYEDLAYYPLHQYWPQSGTLIGFTAFSEDNLQTETQFGNLQSGWYHPLPFDIHDPTTWGTLIFMADR